MSADLFSSSFEEGQPQPKWASTVETDAQGNPRASGVNGTDSVSIPGNVTDKVVDVRANSENTEGAEVKENLVDGNVNSKWLTFTSTGWAEFRFSEPTTVKRYALSSANDAAVRDPKNWTLQGSTDGQTWTTIDTRTNEVFPERQQTKPFETTNTTAYTYYKLDITANAGGVNLIQLAEVQFSDGSATPAPENMRTVLSKGATGGYNAKAFVGFTGLKALRYQGTQVATGRGYSYNKLFEVDVPVTRTTELSYMIFPSFMTDDLNYPSTFAAVDLAFSDGTYLSDLGALDQHGFELSPKGQGASKALYTNQWNRLASVIGSVAEGKTIKRVLVGYDNPKGPANFDGWFDDIVIKSAPTVPDYQRPTDYVRTTRGTNSSGSFSRGNNFPATAVPHGFNFWTPMTNAGSTSWFYDYAKFNNADNLPTIQAFTASHEPSPWMRDRQTFQVMPSTGTPTADRAIRALPFKHENETDRAHQYSVEFENGMRTEIAPTDHAAVFKFDFVDNSSNLVFDNVNNSGGLTLDAATGVVSGYSDVGLSFGATRMFVYGTVDQPVKSSGKLTGQGRDNVAGYFQFDTSTQKTVNLKIATSLLSVDQAKKNLALEISPQDTFDSVKQRAQQAWDKQLSIIEVEGASQDQLTTLYSSLYRLYLYPNSGFENTGSAAAPVLKYASPVSPSTGPSTPTQTGAKVVDGKIYVNNGFWDTYRTAWPAYTLFTPSKAGELADGFVQQYRDGGWVSRWSSPGYANLMTGTSSDVAFTDAYVKGVTNLDVQANYDAAVKNASVTPPDDNVGRHGQDVAVFKGYTPTTTKEGMSWAIEGYLNDFGIANMSKVLYDKAAANDPRKKEYLENYEYFTNRALNYVNMFDPATGFFQGRNPDGTRRVPAADFNPQEWGYDYTETNAWNQTFSIPQDGQGLANLYGGRDGLAKKLDEFFSTPETAKFPGSYGGIIHEMTEARDVRMGQLGHSNQISHHISYMYDFTGQPWKTQEKVREITRRLYLGSEIGQGYAGDEDNGEQSAWFLFSALGFYPAQMGNPTYSVGSPLFTKATLKLENGKKLVVNAPKNSAKNIYVQNLKINGKVWDKSYLNHDVLAAGATLDFDMGPNPSKWATGADSVPPSLTKGNEVAKPLRDITLTGKFTGPAALVDDTSQTQAAVDALQLDLPNTKEKAEFYTLTSAKGVPAGQPNPDAKNWVLKGSLDGKTWTTADERKDQKFTWRQHTRAFKIAKPGFYRYYRLEVAGGATLSEFELLAKPPVTATRTITEPVAGPLTVASGVTVVDGATISGPVTVNAGASLYVFGGKVNGPIAANGAGSVVLVDTEVGGPVSVIGATGAVNIENTKVGGPVSVVNNRAPVVLAGNRIGGPMTGSGNIPDPVNNGLANTVQGPKAGQLADL